MLNNEQPLEKIKDTYGKYIDDAVIQCINEYGGLEINYLKSLIGRIWINQFLPASRNLDKHTITSVRLMFDEIIRSLDSSRHDLDDCIALMEENQVRSLAL